VKAEGYLMDATLKDGVLSFEGRGRAGRFALDWQMSERLGSSVPEGPGTTASEAVTAFRAALAAKSNPVVPVGDIDEVQFSDANPVKNGNITIHAYGYKAKFVSRRKTRDQARALCDELEQEIAQARSGP
jgi:hypothetical protein